MLQRLRRGQAITRISPWSGKVACYRALRYEQRGKEVKSITSTSSRQDVWHVRFDVYKPGRVAVGVLLPSFLLPNLGNLRHTPHLEAPSGCDATYWFSSDTSTSQRWSQLSNLPKTIGPQEHQLGHFLTLVLKSNTVDKAKKHAMSHEGSLFFRGSTVLNFG
ncbi:hypothetical protein EV421DRAFT_1738899 [Armillaria borealis]|uniref:Uncharacterized protein n=1 Tax=Armillaria borealis TaxID=47425 RepID=A0AA39J9F3_9AGAR|nr:hypothetical protein EV421DRAFT_1738899 [Armillaria borealis]